MTEQSPKDADSPRLDPKVAESYSRILVALIAVLGFLWGVFQYLDTRDKQAETRRIEATRPYLERQLTLYTEATQLASKIATANYEGSDEDPVGRFWELYWGELALVEDERVEGAMKAFGDALDEGASAYALQKLSLSLAHACRDSLAESWGVQQWQRPTYDRP